MVCSKCGQALREGVRFCEKCGARVAGSSPEPAAGPVKVRLCSNCGSSITSNSKSCKWCGAAVK